MDTPRDATARFIDRLLLPVADQHVAARGRELWTVFLEASQNGKIALIHQLAAKTLDVARACLLLLVCARTSKGTGRSWDAQQGECQKEFVHGCYLLQTWTAPATPGGQTPFIPSPLHGRRLPRTARYAAAAQEGSRQAKGSSS